MRVLTFGTFDPLHEGHRHFFKQAAALGDSLTVVVTPDAAISAEKGRKPFQSQAERREAVQKCPGVTEAILGDQPPHTYQLLQQLPFDILALGYDQQPDDDTVKALLIRLGKPNVRVARLAAFEPEKYKSSYFRNSD